MLLQQALAQCTPDQAAPRAHRLAGARVVLACHQAGVDLHQVHGDQVARLVHALGDVVTLAQRQAAADGGACAGGPLRVEGIDVKAEVDWGVVADVGEGHLHNATDAVSVWCWVSALYP